MNVVRTSSFARAGFLGNPSDGYFGKTVAFSFTQFGVDLTLSESSRIRFQQGEVDDASFSSMEELVRNLRLYGYYGGIRLLKAVTKRFFEYCRERAIDLPKRNFLAEYKINIPRLVGLSGSSAICSAMLKALMKFYGVSIPLELQPTICLEAERDELGINCGYQDRVIQVYNGLVFMDFEKTHLEAQTYGRYERLDASVFTADRAHLYLAYDAERAEESGQAHKRVKRLFEQRNQDVIAAMGEFAAIAQEGRDILVRLSAANADVARGVRRLNELVNANFDLRDRIFNVAEENRRMVMTARKCGASAKFAGSGGAIVGLYEDEAQLRRLRADLASIGSVMVLPTIATTGNENVTSAADWRNS